MEEAEERKERKRGLKSDFLGSAMGGRNRAGGRLWYRIMIRMSTVVCGARAPGDAIKRFNAAQACDWVCDIHNMLVHSPTGFKQNIFSLQTFIERQNISRDYRSQ